MGDIMLSNHPSSIGHLHSLNGMVWFSIPDFGFSPRRRLKGHG